MILYFVSLPVFVCLHASFPDHPAVNSLVCVRLSALSSCPALVLCSAHLPGLFFGQFFVFFFSVLGHLFVSASLKLIFCLLILLCWSFCFQVLSRTRTPQWSCRHGENEPTYWSAAKFISSRFYSLTLSKQICSVLHNVGQG